MDCKHGLEGKKEWFSKLIALLPHDNGFRIWTVNEHDDEILCENEQIAETLADMFDEIYGEPTVNTGYYDPIEDRNNNEADERTGYYYVTIG